MKKICGVEELPNGKFLAYYKQEEWIFDNNSEAQKWLSEKMRFFKEEFPETSESPNSSLEDYLRSGGRLQYK